MLRFQASPWKVRGAEGERRGGADRSGFFFVDVRLPVKSIRCDEARAVSHPGSVSTQTQLKWSQQQLIASQKLRQIILLTAIIWDKRDAGRQLHMLLLFPGSLTVVRRRVPGLGGTFWSSPEQEVGLVLRGSRSISGMMLCRRPSPQPLWTIDAFAETASQGRFLPPMSLLWTALSSDFYQSVLTRTHRLLSRSLAKPPQRFCALT